MEHTMTRVNIPSSSILSGTTREGVSLVEQTKKRILTGDRTTGRLHLGHYVGSLKSRVELQDSYDTFILLADVQALTTHFEHPELINSSIYDVAMDNLAVGLDPAKVTLVQQSQVTSIAELTVFYSMIVTVNQLRHNPTIKTEAKNYGYADLTYGFLGYPVSQTADITFCNAHLVPVGEDQVPHIELARKIVASSMICTARRLLNPRRSSALWEGCQASTAMQKWVRALAMQSIFPIPPKQCGSGCVMRLPILQESPRRPRGIRKYATSTSTHCVFNPEESDDIAYRCRNGLIGCVACKKRLNEVLNAMLDPIRERRAYYEAHRSEVRDLIIEGTRKANQIGNDNLHAIKEKMHVLI
jgi:tryptophanyl-tRNA synthetase